MRFPEVCTDDQIAAEIEEARICVVHVLHGFQRLLILYGSSQKIENQEASPPRSWVFYY